MKNYKSTEIKNIAIAGHAGSGKTSLTEALLYKSGATDRAGKVLEGTTVSDFTPEEIKRKSSVYTSLSSFESEGLKFNILDTPGLFDCEGEAKEGIYASGCVMITVSGKSGVKVGTHKAYDTAKEMGKPTMFVVTKLDDDNANFNNVLTQLKTEFGPTVCPVVVPVIADRKIVSYVNLIEMKAYKYENGKAVETDMPTAEVSEKMEYRIDGLIEAVSEAVASTDEALFDKFFSGEAFTQKELTDGIHKGMKEGVITPVTCVSSADFSGVDMLLKEMSLLIPTQNEEETVICEDAQGEPVEAVLGENQPAVAYVFKTVSDPFIGKMSLVKVLSGSLKSGDEVVNASTGNTEKIGKIVTLMGKKQLEIPSAVTGEIVAVLKMNSATFDTLCAPSRVVKLPKINLPKPCFNRAVKAVNQGEETKLSAAIAKILEEDKTLSYGRDDSTGEMILSGLGEQHLLSVMSRLKSDFGVYGELTVPKISYRETIRKKVKVQGRHKKQSGGHGQYGDVWIEFEPCISDELVFETKIVGGAVPKNFFPAVEKGLQESMSKGVLAGFPVVDIKAILVDGSYHPVDSSEMAFKIAASIAFKEGMKQAEPVLLEPIGALNVTVPDTNTGDIMGELNKRRGRVLGMNPTEKQGLTEIVAEVPMAEMSDFATILTQMTQGRGTFTFEKVRYEQLPENMVAQVIAENASVDD